jgi:phage terminase large subunit-like protein
MARWIEKTLIQPIGVGAGDPVKLAKFQRMIMKRLVDALAAFISISAGNGKTTLMAALALERIARGDDYVEVDILATKEDQARRLISAAVRMVESSPKLQQEGLFDVFSEDTVLVYRPTGSKMTAHPAKLSAVQGLNFNLALIDEISEVPPELVTTMIARLGKRPDQRVIGFGTPGFGPDNMLEELRKRHHSGELPAGVEFIEFAADAGCDIHDEVQWKKANPAIEAGFLIPESLALKAAVMPEYEFRAYHLGQPVDTVGLWLPHNAWVDCMHADPPPDGAHVVLAVWGNYRRQIAVVGSTMDGAVFFGWAGEKPTDSQLETVIRRACEQWEVEEIVHKPHIRVNLMEKLLEDGLPVEPWPADLATDKDSTSQLYLAIAENEIAHDHTDILNEQVQRLTAQVDRQGNPRLVESEDDVSAALAARAAWWRARALADSVYTGELVIY